MEGKLALGLRGLGGELRVFMEEMDGAALLEEVVLIDKVIKN